MTRKTFIRSLQKLGLLLGVLGLLQACASIPPTTHSEYTKIITGPGPEDMVLDTLSGSKARLLISCNDHRLQEKAPRGNIFVFYPDQKEKKAKIIPRKGDPDTLRLHPHGIYLIRQAGKPYLYVISHDDNRGRHYVIKYLVKETTLDYIDTYTHPFMNSPNSVVALSKGGFYATNDQGKRGDQFATFMKMKTGSIVYCDEQGGWARVGRKLAYPNGIYITPKERYLYVSTTRQQKVFKYSIKSDGNLLNRERVTPLKGGDNIRAANQRELLIPGHLKVFKFVKHFKDSTALSPSVVYSVDRYNGEKRVVYANEGEQISAASTAIYHKGYYYISQVFQSFIIRIKE